MLVKNSRAKTNCMPPGLGMVEVVRVVTEDRLPGTNADKNKARHTAWVVLAISIAFFAGVILGASINQFGAPSAARSPIKRQVDVDRPFTLRCAQPLHIRTDRRMIVLWALDDELPIVRRSFRDAVDCLTDGQLQSHGASAWRSAMPPS